MNDSKKVNSSIIFKLNSWHISKLFASFLWVDIIIIVLFTGAIFYHAEHELERLAKTTNPAETLISEAPHGDLAPEIIRNNIFPEGLRNAVRRVTIDEYSTNFWEKLTTSRYVMWIPYENGFFTLEYRLGDMIDLFLRLFIILLLFEFFAILNSIGEGARAMKRALKPIEALTQTAKSINFAKTANPTAQLQSLAGTIDTINATRLDKRVPVDIVQDELRDLAGAINGMLDRINESYRSQVRFVSDASHELRTPIAVIQGYANLLDRWGKNDQKALQESIDAIKGEAGNMKDLVEQLLFLARGDNDTMHISMEVMNLSELVAEVVRETLMIDPAHTLSSKIDENIFISGDTQLIKQAIRIFVDNSIKYSPANENIIVNLACDTDYARITVQDNGIGIPPEDLPFVFDRFFRSDESRARKTGGTGLGLSIAKWIIDRHSGKVEILSRKDLGTRISISLLKCSPPTGKMNDLPPTEKFDTDGTV